MQWRSRDGRWRIDLIELTSTSDHRDGQRFRITCDSYFIAEARTVAELGQHIDLADLQEA